MTSIDKHYVYFITDQLTDAILIDNTEDIYKIINKLNNEPNTCTNYRIIKILEIKANKYEILVDKNNWFITENYFHNLYKNNRIVTNNKNKWFEFGNEILNLNILHQDIINLCNNNKTIMRELSYNEINNIMASFNPLIVQPPINKTYINILKIMITNNFISPYIDDLRLLTQICKSIKTTYILPMINQIIVKVPRIKLPHFINLKILTIYVNKYPIIIDKFINLEKLTLITNPNLPNIQNNSTLDCVLFSLVTIKCPNLTSLNITNEKYHIGNKLKNQEIQKLTKLKYINISWVNISSCLKLTRCINLIQLDLLRLDNCINIEVYTLVNLKQINITMCKHLKTILGIDKLNNLESLYIYGCNELRTIPEIDRLTNLKRINIQFCSKLIPLD